jgi:hypothetical protein
VRLPCDSSTVATDRDSRCVTSGQDDPHVPDQSRTLFDGRAGDDSAQVWLEPAESGVVIRSQSWGPGVERHFGFDTMETCLRLGQSALATLAHALVMDRPELDPTMSPIETLAAAYGGDSAATSHARRRLDELRLPYEFTLR